MKRLVSAAILLVLAAFPGRLAAQPSGYDVFSPISKYIAQGNSEALAAWFDDNLEISVISRESSASRAQAKQIVKAFFESYSPKSFDIMHTAGRTNMKYALGNLNAGGEDFQVTVFVCSKGDKYRIQQLKIEQAFRPEGDRMREGGRGRGGRDVGRGRGRGNGRR